MGEGKLRKVGALWKPKPNAKSKGSGSITINGFKQRFVVLPNKDKVEGSSHPDYVLMSSDEPEVDFYTPRASQDSGSDPIADDDGGVPF